MIARVAVSLLILQGVLTLAKKIEIPGNNTQACLPSGTVLTAPSDLFRDHDGGGNYLPNRNCRWLIQPPNAQSIRLVFTSFYTELNYDFVYVYLGNTTNAPQAPGSPYSGATIPQFNIIGSTALLVRFTTDGLTEFPGWTAVYNATVPNVNTACNGGVKLTAPSATFKDHDGPGPYLPNLNCTWLIQPVGAQQIFFEFSSFSTESGYDFVYVHLGNSTSSPLAPGYPTSGPILPRPVTGGSALLVRFRTDGSTEFPGWTASYTSSSGSNTACSGGTTLTAATATFRDHDGGGTYRPNLNCTWLISPGAGRSIVLNFTSFQTEANYDYVFVYLGNNTRAPLAPGFPFSGFSLPPVVRGYQQLLVRFVTDTSNEYNGWTATYTSYINTTTSACGGGAVLREIAAEFQDHYGGGFYQNNANCTWLIQPPNAQTIVLDFTAFRTEAGVDRVWVYLGDSRSSPVAPGFPASGFTLPPSVTGRSALLVQFTTDSTVQYTGWTAVYASSPQMNALLVVDEAVTPDTEATEATDEDSSAVAPFFAFSINVAFLLVVAAVIAFGVAFFLRKRATVSTAPEDHRGLLSATQTI